MINRREFFGITAGAGASLVLTPDFLRALERQQGGTLMKRAIPSTGEMLPVISFGARPVKTDAEPRADVGLTKEVLKTFIGNGGKVVDVLHGGPAGEEAARTAAMELGIQDKLFWTTPLNGPMGPGVKPDVASLRAEMEQKFARFKVNKIDLVMVGATQAVENPAYFTVLQELKKEGRVRYIGAHDLATPPYPPQDAFGRLEQLMRGGQIDFVGTDYIASWRGVEERLLPLAQERKIAFMAYFPFDRGRIFKRIGTTPLPEWAAEVDAKTWAQLLLKYVLGHPAVVVAREGTTNAAHMLDNIGGGIGRLPDAAMRKRIAQLVDSLPPTPVSNAPAQAPPGFVISVAVPAAVLDRYVGEYKAASGFTATFRRDGDKLVVKPGNNPETPLIAHSETRFQDPRGPFFQFEVDAQGKVTGAVLEQGAQKIPLVRQ